MTPFPSMLSAWSARRVSGAVTDFTKLIYAERQMLSRRYSNMKYALGTLNAGGELFLVTIFVGYDDTAYRIQHLKIERLN